MSVVCGTAPPLRAGPEADLVCYIAAPLAASWQPALCLCGLWPKPRCRRCAMSGPRPVWAHLPRRVRLCACRKSVNLQTVILREKNGPSSTSRRPRTRRRAGAARRHRPAAGAIGRSRGFGWPGGYGACPGAGTAGQAAVPMLVIWGRFRFGASFPLVVRGARPRLPPCPGGSGLLGGDQPGVVGEDDCLDAVAEPEFAQQAGDVAFHGGLADVQAPGQLGVG